MDQIQHFAAQLKAMFYAAESGRRMIMLGAPALVLIGLFTMRQAGSPQLVPLVGASAADLSVIDAQFKAAGLTDYQVKDDRILVPVDRADHYRTVANRQNQTDANEWEKQFSKTGIFTTRDQLQAARDIALEKTICRSILAVPAIKDVSVTWARSQKRRWSSKAAQVTATVCVTPCPDSTVTHRLAHSLQIAVANMVPDLQPDHVTIFDQSTGQSTGAYGGFSDTRIAHRAMEESYRARIQAALAFIPDSTVTVTASSSAAGHDHNSGDRPAIPTASANSIPQAITNQDELHVSVFVPEHLHSTFVKTEGTELRGKIEQTIHRIVEPSAVLASLDIGATTESARIAKSTIQPRSNSPASSAWLISLVVIIMSAFLIFWTRRWKVAPRDLGSARDESRGASSSLPSNNEQFDDVNETVESGINLDSVLKKHPHESLAMLQQWTENNGRAAAAVAGRLDPTTAAGFAARMSDDERTLLHSALQQPPSNDDVNTVNAFCRQVAQAATAPRNAVAPLPQPPIAKPVLRSGPPLENPESQSRLYELPPRLIARLLDGEQPQTVAIALARLDTSTIDRILRNFSLARSSQIRQRLDSANNFPSTLSDDVELAVLQRLPSHGTSENVA